MIKILSASDIKNKLNSGLIGKEIIVFDEVDSTNSIAKEMAKNGAAEGTTVIAAAQTMGRGRMGRSFFSPKGKGIYMSVILRGNFAKSNPLLITSMAAVAAARAVDKLCGTNAEIKWVNDIYLSGKKICGILAESLIDPNEISRGYIILGIGINVGQTDFPQEIKAIATSIENETGKAVSKTALICQVLNQLDTLYKEYETGEYLEEYRKRSMILGKEVKAIRGNEVYIALAEDIDEKGGLILNRHGKREVLSSGEVSIRLNDEN